jgi:hypothetical protein
MTKQIYRILDDLSPCDVHLRNLPRKPDGLYNFCFNEYGQIKKRAGYSKYNTDSLGADHKIMGMHRFYTQANLKEFLVVWNTKVYKLSDTTPWAGTALYSTGTTDFTVTADKETFFADFLNHTYFVNGVNGVFKYDRSFVRTVGITVPGAPTGISNPDGDLTVGWYYYKYTFVDEDGYESNGGTASIAMEAFGHPIGGIKIGIAASSDKKVTKRRIYRTTVGGASNGVFYYDGEVADNTTLTYDSILSDATISLNEVLHADHDIPPTTSHLITKRLSRLFLANAEKLYISYLSDCEYFPIDWYIQTGNMQKISALVEQKYTLPVLTDDTVERLLYTDEDNFQLENTYSTQGCIAYRSAVNCDNLLVYLGFEGLYYFDGVDVKELNIPLNEYIKANINEAYASLSAACYFDNKYLFSYPKGESTVPNETLYYDFRYHTYGIYNFAFGCYSKWDKGADGLQLKGGSTTIGRVYSVLTGTTDDDAAITAYDSPEPIDLGIPEVYKQWYSILIKIKTTSGTALRFYYTLDNKDETYVDKTLTANTTKWYRIGFTGDRRARAFKPRPYISDSYDATIMGYMLWYDLEPSTEEIE